MKRNILYLILLIVLAGAAYFLVLKKPWGTLDVNDTAFAVEDTAAISKIFIADMQGKKVTIQRQKNFWTVDQKYVVRGDYMDVLLNTINRVSIKYPVPQAAMNKVVSEMASHNKKVEIYDRNNKLMNAYYVGGPSLDATGTYMLMEGSKQPYVTTMAGFQGVLESRYQTDEQQIRSTSIFNYHLNEINKVTVTYPGKTDSSFFINVYGPDSFEVSDFSKRVIPTAQLDKEKVHSYLHLFEFINAEAFVNDLPGKDTILNTQPFCMVTLTDRKNTAHSAVCYHMPVQQDTPQQFDIKGNRLKYDTDRYYAHLSDGDDLVIIQQFHFGRLFRNADYFKKSGKAMKR